MDLLHDIVVFLLAATMIIAQTVILAWLVRRLYRFITRR